MNDTLIPILIPIGSQVKHPTHGAGMIIDHIAAKRHCVVQFLNGHSDGYECGELEILDLA